MVFASLSSALAVGCLVLGLGPLQVFGFNNSRADNLAVYWGQNSRGAEHKSGPEDVQRSLAHYCKDDMINVFPIGFVHAFFSDSGMPAVDISNICHPSGGRVFEGTKVPNCDFLSDEIKACQEKGKIVTISLGGATADVGFNSDWQAEKFADTIWDMFLGGSGWARPFGDAVLDGVDLDIEGGSPDHYPAFVTQIRARAKGAPKKYYVTAAPQCPFPDRALGSVLNAVGFDAVYVQFYNNYCGVESFDDPERWNFGTWDHWAKTESPNKDVKVYIGAPASGSAAGSGYVDAARLGEIARATRDQYSSFGGIMLWDASQAYANDRFDMAIKKAIDLGGADAPTSDNCTGIPPWVKEDVYHHGEKVNYEGHLWMAQWWSRSDVPGGTSGVWKDNGACSVAPAPEETPTEAWAEPKASKAPKAKKPKAFKAAPSSECVRRESPKKNSRFFKGL